MEPVEAESKETIASAAGLFGYSITNGERCAFKSFAGYMQEIERMPHFAPPPVSRFVARYVESSIGQKTSSS